MKMKTKLRIRDKLLNFPKAYRTVRAFYKSWQTFRAINNEPIRQRNSFSDSNATIRKILATFIPFKVEPQLTVVGRLFERKPTTLDIIIPVFNRGDLATRLIRSLQNQIDNLDKGISVTLICADDSSDPATSRILSQVCNQFNYTYVRRERNLGFIGNVNAAWESSNGEFVLLLNSDVIVTEGYLDRLLDPLIHDKEVGLSTNPSFSMFAKRLESGVNLNSLNSYLFATSEDTVSFVDACTAVGYSLVIRREAADKHYLFDPQYGRGYGEDSDLHYRVLTNGYRSVWNLDHAVAHEGGASFDLAESVFSDRAQGKKKFFRKWGLRYFAEIQDHNLALEESIDRRAAGYSNLENTKTWVVMPTVGKNIGGVKVGSELAIQISLRDPLTKIVTIDDSESAIIGDYISVARTTQIFESKTFSEIILVGAQALSLLNDEHLLNSNFKFTYFCQGPDWIIDPSTLSLYREFIPRISEVISVSAYMDDEIDKFAKGTKISRYEPEIEYAKYSGLRETAKNIDFLFFYREEHGKQGWLALALANFLSSTHSVAMVSNQSIYGLSEKVRLVRNLDRTSTLRLFARSKVFIDTSFFEGFGLMSREAAFQNTKVLFMDVVDGRNELKNYPKHFSLLRFSPSIFVMAEKALEVLDDPPCIGCKFCS